ncbi:type II secretion system protein GspD, partial [Ottowia beijingensis]
MSRTPLSLVVLLLLASLAACAQPAAPLADTAPAQLPAEALPTAGILAPAPAPAASAPVAADDARHTDPIIIRGNDRLVAPPRIAANAPARGSTSLKFEGAPAAEVVKVMLSDLLKVDYVIHPPLAGSITLTTRDAVSADRALLLLETALQVNGIVMARDSRGTYHVGTPEALRGVVSAPALAAGGQPLPPGYGAVIIPLQYLGAGEMANILRPMVSADAILRVDSLRNILVMRGTRAEAEGWLDLVATFDVNLLRGMSVGVFPLKHTSAAEVDAALRLLSSGTAGGSAAAPAAPGGRPAA